MKRHSGTFCGPGGIIFLRLRPPTFTPTDSRAKTTPPTEARGFGDNFRLPQPTDGIDHTSTSRCRIACMVAGVGKVTRASSSASPPL